MSEETTNSTTNPVTKAIHVIRVDVVVDSIVVEDITLKTIALKAIALKAIAMKSIAMKAIALNTIALKDIECGVLKTLMLEASNCVQVVVYVWDVQRIQGWIVESMRME